MKFKVGVTVYYNNITFPILVLDKQHRSEMIHRNISSWWDLCLGRYFVTTSEYLETDKTLTNVPALGLSEYKPGGRGHRTLQLNTNTYARRETWVLESSNDPPNRIILLTDRDHLLWPLIADNRLNWVCKARLSLSFRSWQWSRYNQKVDPKSRNYTFKPDTQPPSTQI